jgi:hypothetical protein
MRYALLSLLVCCVLLVGAPVGAQSLCPQLYAIPDVGAGGGVPARDTYNVLFLGNGFASSDLDTYHRAIELFLESLSTTPPYDGYLDRMKFYYMDLTSSTGVDSSCTACPTAVPGTTTSPTLSSAVVRSGDAEWALDLGIDCVCDDDDNFEGLDFPVLGQLGALGLSFCAPNIRAVVVIANADCSEGLTYQYEPLVGVSWALVSLDVNESAGDLEIWEAGLALFHHELGHQLGLLDEYTDDKVDPWIYPRRRNLWKADLADEWVPDEDVQTCPAIPWEHSMCPTAEVDPAEVPPKRCDTFLIDCGEEPPPDWDTTPPIYLERSEDTLALFASTYKPDACVAHDPKLTGLWEGGFYTKDGYFRARATCRMSELGAAFCEACERQVGDVLCRYGAGAGTGCPTAIPDRTTDCDYLPPYILFP